MSRFQESDMFGGILWTGRGIDAGGMPKCWSPLLMLGCYFDCTSWLSVVGRDVGWRKTGIKNRTRSSTNQATKWLLCFVGLGSPSTDFEPVFRGRRLIYPTIGRFDGLVFAERLRVAGTRDGMWINRNCQSIRSYTHDYCSPHLIHQIRGRALHSFVVEYEWWRVAGQSFSIHVQYWNRVCRHFGLDIVEEFVSMWDIEIRSRMSSSASINKWPYRREVVVVCWLREQNREFNRHRRVD